MRPSLHPDRNLALRSVAGRDPAGASHPNLGSQRGSRVLKPAPSLCLPEGVPRPDPRFSHQSNGPVTPDLWTPWGDVNPPNARAALS